MSITLQDELPKEPTLKDKLKAIDAWISAAKYGLSEPEHLDKVSATLGVAQRILREVISETKN